MNTRSKLVTLAGLAALATVASAATLASIFGYLSPNHYRDHYFSVGIGWYDVDLSNANAGDLDAAAIDESNVTLDSDTLPDNHPMLSFYSDHAQTIKVRVINASTSRSADYDGTIEYGG